MHVFFHVKIKFLLSLSFYKTTKIASSIFKSYFHYSFDGLSQQKLADFKTLDNLGECNFHEHCNEEYNASS